MRATATSFSVSCLQDVRLWSMAGYAIPNGVVLETSGVAEIEHTCLSSFKCSCSFCKEKGHLSCLEQFNKPQLRAFHRAVYKSDTTSKREVLRNAHELLWQLREPLEKSDSFGRVFQVKTFKLDGRPVCREAWKAAYNIGPSAFKTSMAMTCRGHGPDSRHASQLASATARKFSTQTETKLEWAVCWWVKHLMVQDFLPNQEKIQYRGPAFAVTHRTVYKVEAMRCGMALECKHWLRARGPALARLARDLYPAGK